MKADVKYVMQLNKKPRQRKKDGVFVVEGPKMFTELPAFLRMKTFVSESFLKEETHKQLLAGIPFETVKDSVFEQMSDTKTPQGILAVARQLSYEMGDLLGRENGRKPLLLVLDKIQDPVGIEYGDESLTVKSVFDTEKMQSTLDTMRKYYEKGYINKDAATASDDKSVKRFVTKGDGQPYAELVWAKDLGYEVVASPIMDTQVTNASARGALTAINANSEHPEKAMEFLNLVNTDQYLRNLLNYGIEGTHWERVEVPQEELDAAEGKPYIYDCKVKLDPEKSKDYSVPYYVQGGLFNTYVLDNEPIDKWATFKEFNDEAQEAPSFGFDFDLTEVSTQVAGFRNILDEFGKSLYTGSVDPDEYVPQLEKKMEATGIDDVIKEMQKQIDEWKTEK